MMNSLKEKDNTEAIVKHHPDDPLDEEILKTTGDELDDPRDEEVSEITGDELDDPGNEEVSEITGDELDDPVNEAVSGVSGDELDDPIDEGITKISGHELDDSENEEISKITEHKLDASDVSESNSSAGNEVNRSKDNHRKTNTEKKIKFKDIKKKLKDKKTLFLFLMSGVCLLVGGSYYFFQHTIENKIIPRSNIFPVPHDKSIIFESFILPIQKKQGYTYISLNLLLELSNIKLKEEIVEKKDQLRGIIYDILEQEIHRVEDANALDKLKALIISRSNAVLTSGEVREAFITNFVVV